VCGVVLNFDDLEENNQLLRRRGKGLIRALITESIRMLRKKAWKKIALA